MDDLFKNSANNEIEKDESGIEKEYELDTEKGTEIEEPFDPKLVHFEPKTLTIDLLIKRIKNEEIEFTPGFQRKADLWNLKKQSQLIESLLIRIPLPVFYFDGKEDDKWQIIDGLQRLTTFKNFIIEQNFSLQNLEYLVQYKDYKYDKLPRDLKRRIEETQILVYIMKEHTPDEVKFNLFKRINTGGLFLEPQEIRHALNQGKPAEFVEELAELKEFKEATLYSVKPDRMKDRDLVLRFISFFQTKYREYKPDPDLDSFLNKAMADINKLTDKQRTELKNNFIKSMILSKEIFRDYAFRKRFSLDDMKKNPINKALFETVSVNFAKLSDKEIQNLRKKKDEFVKEFFNLFHEKEVQGSMFLKSITSATSDTGAVHTRFSNIENLLKNYITND